MAVRFSTLVTPVRAVAVLLAAMFVTGGSWSFAGDMHDGFEAPSPTWAAAPTSGRVVVHERSEVSPHRGRSCERLAIETTAGRYGSNSRSAPPRSSTNCGPRSGCEPVGPTCGSPCGW